MSMGGSMHKAKRVTTRFALAWVLLETVGPHLQVVAVRTLPTKDWVCLDELKPFELAERIAINDAADLVFRKDPTTSGDSSFLESVETCWGEPASVDAQLEVLAETRLAGLMQARGDRRGLVFVAIFEAHVANELILRGGF
jgi:hypothetical protein